MTVPAKMHLPVGAILQAAMDAVCLSCRGLSFACRGLKDRSYLYSEDIRWGAQL
jgi:hypothetical protein